jgi:hypothetical protein
LLQKEPPFWVKLGERAPKYFLLAAVAKPPA